MNCPYCNSNNLSKKGKLESGTQRYYCKDCGKRFSETTKILKPITKKCPYCNGELRYYGYNKSGSRRYECKECGKRCSDIAPTKPRIIKDSYDDIECPYCKSTRTKGRRKSNRGYIRYHCKDCKKSFSEKTIVRERIPCTHCNSTNTLYNGKDKGRQRFLCKDCGIKFIVNPIIRIYNSHEQICPHCGHNKAKKAGFSNGEQLWICKNCGHKYSLNNKFKYLTEQDCDKIKQLYLQGKTIAEIGKILNISVKTIYNRSKNIPEELTQEQKDIIYSFGVRCQVPPNWIAPFIGCSIRKCTEELKKYNIIKVRKAKNKITAEEKAEMDQFLPKEPGRYPKH